jgi:AcrR family transcriptional regulator
MSPPSEPSGLRERKKARTKASIQAHAVRLFLEQGYDATTVEQVAEAAEVATSTVFRYFPAKEDLVVSDDYDPMVIAAFEAQPAGLSPIQALRTALRTALAELSPDELTIQRERTILTLSVPALWGASLRNLTETMQLLIGLMAKRIGRPTDDEAIRAFAGAAIGVMLEVMFRWSRTPDLDIVDELDRALAYLDAGFPFG